MVFFLYCSGVTHKKTIIEYCENKIKKATMSEELFDRASYILLYELMIMLIQQNGVGTFFSPFEIVWRGNVVVHANQSRLIHIERRWSRYRHALTA